MRKLFEILEICSNICSLCDPPLIRPFSVSVAPHVFFSILGHRETFLEKFLLKAQLYIELSMLRGIYEKNNLDELMDDFFPGQSQYY